jgi:hypothetical protein
LKNFEIKKIAHRKILKVPQNYDIPIDLTVGAGIGVLVEAVKTENPGANALTSI